MRVIKTALLLFLLAPQAYCAKTHAEIAAENAQSVVTVNVLQKNGAAFTGSGFIVTPSGVIATNKHVVENALFINITFNTGIISSEAKIAALSPNTDLALLKIPSAGLTPVILGNSDDAKPGEVITVIGNPRRLQNTITHGLLSQVRLMKNGAIWQQISAPISPSSSGSPVFNSDGHVIGIAFSSFKGDGNQNLNFSIPSNYIRDLMMENGYLPRAPEKDSFTLKGLFTKFINYIKRAWSILMRYLGI